MEEQYLTAAFISLPLSQADSRKFEMEAGGCADEQAPLLASNLQNALTMFKGYGKVGCYVAPKRYDWQAEGYYIYVLSESAHAATLLHQWLERMDAGIEGIILPMTWKASVDDEKKEPMLLQMQKQ